MGVKLEIVPTSWPTLMSDFRAGKFDIALSGVSVTAERSGSAILGQLPARWQDPDHVRQRGALPDAGADQSAGRALIVNPGGTNDASPAHARTHS
jgi:hypothetical protein